MKTLCITGLIDDHLTLLAQCCAQAGMAMPNEPDQLGVSITQWHEKVLATHQPHPETGQIATLGKLWERLASDLFVQHMPHPLWGWASSHSVSLLNFWSEFEPNIRFVLLTCSPQRYLAHQLEASQGQVDVVRALSTWKAQHQAMLYFHLRHSTTSVMVDVDQVVQQPQRLLDYMAQQWQLDGLGEGQGDALALPQMPMVDYLAHAYWNKYQDETLHALQDDLTATSLPLALTEDTQSLCLSGSHNIDEIVVDYYQQQQKKTLEKKQLQQALSESQAESELLLAQLHQVQESLEEHFLQLKASQAAHDQVKQQLSGKEVELIKANEQSSQLSQQLSQQQSQHQQALQSLQEENELMLEQLHLVQEELEKYFLMHRDVENALAEYKEQSKQVALQAEARWQRLLQRYPNYIDYTHVSFIPVIHNGVWQLNCAFDALTLDKTYNQLHFAIQIENGMAGLVFNADQRPHFVRWPITGDRLELLPQPCADSQQAQDRVAVFQQSATHDWQLLTRLVKALPALIEQKSPLASSEVLVVNQALASLAKVMDKVPTSMRYDALVFEQERVYPGYEHLALAIEGLSWQGRVYPHFSFRLGCANISDTQFGSDPKLEFPQAEDTPLGNWFAESEDEFGQKLELRFALPDAMDIQVWQQLASDQVFIVTLLSHLPTMMTQLSPDLALQHDLAQWQSLVINMQAILAYQLQAAAQET
ncbi:MAG: hypothetical protein M1572_01545 [Gammaproteobacteria bacterium]|nr:hypothetical protein [Gammaproteobacteria bacterium]